MAKKRKRKGDLPEDESTRLIHDIEDEPLR
jgi:hypothetical protein